MTISKKALEMLKKGNGVYTSKGTRVLRASSSKHVYYIVRDGRVYRTDPKSQRTKLILTS